VASKRQIDVGGLKIGGGAPVAIQSMTKTETADFDATMRQIHAIADAGGDELTPTMKLKRKPIHQKYEKEIEALYG
jgi:4-hydroxy-3-methylbut-2-en-1-yl diphosphate synthase IspG/GcpE